MRRLGGGAVETVRAGLLLLALGGCASFEPSPAAWFGGEASEEVAAAPAPAASPTPPGVPHVAVTAPSPEPGASALPAASKVVTLSVARDGVRTRVAIELDGFVEPAVSLLESERLVLDLPGTSAAAVPRVVEADDPLVARLRTGQHEGGARVVVDLERRADFAVRAEPRRVVVTLAAPGAADEPAPAVAAAPQDGAILLPAEGAPAEATPEPSAVPPATPPSPAPSPEPLPSLEPSPEPSASPEPAPEASPSPEPAPSPVAPQATPSPGGERRISVDFDEADLRTVISLIARAGGYQVVFAPSVDGTVTLSVVDRPWEEALDIVLRAKRLREVRHADVMLVSPADR